jgi:2'-5' RNA ligase
VATVKQEGHDFTKPNVHDLFYQAMGEDAGSSGRLFLAVLPDADTSARIHRLAGGLKQAHGLAGKLIEPDRLHVSLFFLGGLPEPDLQKACEAVAKLHASPFEVRFDRTVSFRGKAGHRPFVLLEEDGASPLRSFRRMLGVAIMREGLRRLANTNFTPHVTLLYDKRDVPEYPTVPILWTVRDVVLIHSMNGHARLARWAL